MPVRDDQLLRLVIAVSASASLVLVMLVASLILWHFANFNSASTSALTSTMFPAAGGGGFALLLGVLVKVFAMLLKQEKANG